MGSAARPGEHGGGRERTGWGQWPGCLGRRMNCAAKIFDQSCMVSSESTYWLPLSERRSHDASFRPRRTASRNGLEDFGGTRYGESPRDAVLITCPTR